MFIFLTFNPFIKRFVLETGSTPPSTSRISAIIETRGVSFRSIFRLVNGCANLVICNTPIKYVYIYIYRIGRGQNSVSKRYLFQSECFRGKIYIGIRRAVDIGRGLYYAAPGTIGFGVFERRGDLRPFFNLQNATINLSILFWTHESRLWGSQR